MKLRVKRHAVVQPHDQSIRYIPLTQGLVAIVDAIDYDYLSQWNWYAGTNGNRGTLTYGYRSITRRGRKIMFKLHRAVLDHAGVRVPTGHVVDHVNGDGLDNRRCNVRPATRSQNAMNRPRPANNTSGFKGVTWDKVHEKWAVRLTISGGYFDSAEEAGRVYDDLAVRYLGEFAKLNFPSQLDKGVRGL